MCSPRNLSHAAEAMRYTALEAIMRPGATELDIAKGSQALVSQIVPLRPVIQDMLFMQLRHMMETEAVDAGERAAGKPLPGARRGHRAFADLVGFTLGEVVSLRRAGHLARLAGFRACSNPLAGVVLPLRRSATRSC